MERPASRRRYIQALAWERQKRRGNRVAHLRALLLLLSGKGKEPLKQVRGRLTAAGAARTARLLAVTARARKAAQRRPPGRGRGGGVVQEASLKAQKAAWEPLERRERLRQASTAL